jgi:hypothetical protein
MCTPFSRIIVEKQWLPFNEGLAYRKLLTEPKEAIAVSKST